MTAWHYHGERATSQRDGRWLTPAEVRDTDKPHPFPTIGAAQAWALMEATETLAEDGAKAKIEALTLDDVALQVEVWDGGKRRIFRAARCGCTDGAVALRAAGIEIPDPNENPF